MYYLKTTQKQHLGQAEGYRPNQGRQMHLRRLSKNLNGV